MSARPARATIRTFSGCRSSIRSPVQKNQIAAQLPGLSNRVSTEMLCGPVMCIPDPLHSRTPRPTDRDVGVSRSGKRYAVSTQCESPNCLAARGWGARGERSQHSGQHFDRQGHAGRAAETGAAAEDRGAPWRGVQPSQDQSDHTTEDTDQGINHTDHERRL